MINLLAYLCSNGVVTAKKLFPDLDSHVRGLPSVTDAPCMSEECNACVELCPTDVIKIDEKGSVSIDLGGCIACGACTQVCPTGSIAENKSTMTARVKREDLVISASNKSTPPDPTNEKSRSIFKKSIAARVVSTGCSACDLEIGAAGNPIFDMERFGVHVVASPRFADVLVVTGPVPKAMHDPLLRCYNAMAEPRLVVALGTCAISGGVHHHGYTEANGVDNVIPVNVYIPGCPPHPWSIIYGIHRTMNL
jgi:Ni,Fe-hydrogenase III small subunit/NAD-dependent dihydropyrimidine dehydrogenase PreA subunit